MSKEKTEERAPILAHEWDYASNCRLRAIVKADGRVLLERSNVDGLGVRAWFAWQPENAPRELAALEQAIAGMVTDPTGQASLRDTLDRREKLLDAIASISEAEAREAATLKAQGKGWPEIAELLGRSPSPLRRAVMQLGKPKHRRRAWSDLDQRLLRSAMLESVAFDKNKPGDWQDWARNYAWKCQLHPHTVACKVRAILKEAAQQTETGAETK